MTDSRYSLKTCWRKPAKRWCSGYEIASFKYVYGLVSEVRRLLRAGVSPMPQYWLVKDDDTFVHVPNLMRAIERNAGRTPPAPREQLISFAAKGGCNICGGAGWVFSGALAIELATTYGDRFLRFQIEQMEQGNFQYDMHVPKVIDWVKGSQLIHIWEMNPSSVLDRQLCKYRTNAWHGPCYRTAECNCSSTRRPATWHMSISFERSVEQLSLIP
eukprot:UN4897